MQAHEYTNILMYTHTHSRTHKHEQPNTESKIIIIIDRWHDFKKAYQVPSVQKHHKNNERGINEHRRTKNGNDRPD